MKVNGTTQLNEILNEIFIEYVCLQNHPRRKIHSIILLQHIKQSGL